MKTAINIASCIVLFLMSPGLAEDEKDAAKKVKRTAAENKAVAEVRKLGGSVLEVESKAICRHQLA